MRALLTSSGIRNRSIHDALVDLLGKPVAESRALIVPTALHPFPGGAEMAWRTVTGQGSAPLAGLGWKSLGLLELTALPHIAEAAWVPAVREADALLFCGGDPLFLSAWMRRSGLTALLPSLRPEAVYVGVSAGSIAATTTFVETFDDPPSADDEPLKSEPAVFTTPDGDLSRLLVTGRGAGLVGFGVIPHFEHEHHLDASPANAAIWASHIPAPTYAIDDETAIKVVDDTVEIVSEGRWKLFTQP
ncbi:Type 1 glutamine amidotransferase-like domain-containing protein [Actinoplanes sp. LDG1-06]|uniref:Type 1 glutamine amidotransferase-like domain-containing protein n=1 Tax=Paractinoplanes ovalisporus TaxID=2810368 RepID=A0ABS2AK85_9ACTN|nr:Type 1 glutamine amidotransferase-like domain-containing protein [Actinoplanes ovalisporus]MBM2620221.1 Type 1 glutamine amidotransferase-like domain-containing protein [Actinoplanes ovalisporus]